MSKDNGRARSNNGVQKPTVIPSSVRGGTCRPCRAQPTATNNSRSPKQKAVELKLLTSDSPLDDTPECPPQRCKSEPSGRKKVAQLDAEARQASAQIDQWEKYATAAYVRLGLILIALRELFPAGWEAHLNTLGIDQTRWKRARCLAEYFETEDAGRDLPLEKALQMAGWGRKQKQCPKSGKQPKRATNEKASSHASGNDGQSEPGTGVPARHVKLSGQTNGRPLKGIGKQPQAAKTTDPRSAGEILAEFVVAKGWDRDKQRRVVVDFWLSILDTDGLLEDIDYYHQQAQFTAYLGKTAR